MLVNRNVPTVAPHDDLLAAARALAASVEGVLPVVDRDERGARVVGVLSFADLVREAAR